MVIVQHMPMGFTVAFASRLNDHLPILVHEATHGETLFPGAAYIAPSGLHIRLRREGERLQAILGPEPEELLHCPSVDVFFGSAAEILGKRVLAVLMTGMGRDGAEGLLRLKRVGAYTIAQDERSCVIYGMPRAAVALGAASEEVPLQDLGARILELLG